MPRVRAQCAGFVVGVFLCDRKVDTHELSRSWRRPGRGVPAAARPCATRPFAASTFSSTDTEARNSASSCSRRVR
eukprot:4343326-Pyramimonas_sp.AAC.1